MDAILQEIEVAFRYPVHFTQQLFSPDNPLFADVLGRGNRPHKILVVLDAGVARHHPALTTDITRYCDAYADALSLVHPPLVVEGGEGVKNDPAAVSAVHDAVHRFGLDRHAFVVVIGGGAVIDMAGYAAATAHRGVRLVRVPTTVLSQNDSAVGVKNSVNAFGKKNFLGTFAPPYAVLNDSDFLMTLSDRDWLGGISEAVKVALLKDAAFFEWIEAHAQDLVDRDMDAVRYLVYRCAELHLHHIASSGDPFEFGSSRPLDFGHWAAHKLEALSGYELRHGEAVAVGIALDSSYAYLTGMLDEASWRRILDLFVNLRLSLTTPELRDPAVLSGLSEFQEHLGGELTIMLLEGIGRGLEVHEMDETKLRESITLLETYTTNTERGDVWLALAR